MKYFVTAIGTDSGKTLVSAILCQALGAAYYKPIQAGLPTDSDYIKNLYPEVRVVPERYRLKMPASPHSAAKAEGLDLQVADLAIPKEENLIVEGAGGCLVPLNNREFVLDIALVNKLPIILVANLYLGSINHTLLTIEYLKQKNPQVKGLIFNGPANSDSQDIIAHHSPWSILGHVPQLETVNPQTLQSYVQHFREQLA